MIFEENFFSRYILLTDQISLSDVLYFLRYWAILGQSQDKHLNILRKEELLTINKKHF